ncbi:hypothetical protein [Eubacterium barkeri]|uniref:Uncharacterized protein n=1 Tax=Eubacterium barkeri TaxID=1528 RepID=A0A1H3IQ64_EUBBA|nr:hypothetical protein [Eubacterium barkeri]SDY29852.1 hypothetical protein SAMN04488579_12439 [Eubacterium barkeri]
MKYTWSIDEDNEIWENRICESIGECFSEASDYLTMGNIHGLYIGECVPYTKYGIDVDRVISGVKDDAYYYVGEAVEYWIDEMTEEQITELGKELNAVFVKWLKKNNLEPEFYIIENVRYVENPNDR